MANTPLLDLKRLDPDHVVFDRGAIRGSNPQRFEFEQLDHICYVDRKDRIVAGVLDIPAHVWWGRGHMPGRPLMPGVLMLESAAQVCSWFVHHLDNGASHGGKIFGFGGVDAVKFRASITPPARLVVVGRGVEIRSRRAVFETQGYLAPDMDRLVFEARITGLWV